MEYPPSLRANHQFRAFHLSTFSVFAMKSAHCESTVDLDGEESSGALTCRYVQRWLEASHRTPSRQSSASLGDPPLEGYFSLATRSASDHQRVATIGQSHERLKTHQHRYRGLRHTRARQKDAM